MYARTSNVERHGPSVGADVVCGAADVGGGVGRIGVVDHQRAVGVHEVVRVHLCED